MSARASARAENKELLLQRAANFMNQKFVSRNVAPLVPEVAGSGEQTGWLSSIVRAKGTGRITLRYDFAHSLTIYAKAYTDRLGLYSYEALRALWTDGFGPGSSHHVPEPLGFITNENLLLMRRAEGIPLAELLFEQEELQESVIKATRAAARWLAQLHSSEMPFLDVEPGCERIKIFKLGDMLAKAATAYPEQSTFLLDLLQKVRRLAPEGSSAQRLTVTHGQYTPANIFLSGDDVSVIDLDRLCLSDPAKDLAMFIHRIKSLLFKDAQGTVKADRIVREFLDEYKKIAPENLSNLPYYTALYALKGLAKIAKDRGPDDPLRKPVEFFYLSTLEDCFRSGAARPALSAPVSNPSVNGSSKEELGTWACSFKESDFIGRFVYPSVADGQPTAGVLACETTIVQNTGTGRLTLRYDLATGETLYAKLYTDELGPYSHHVMKELWDGGFNDRSRFQVSEPLAFLPEYNFVLMRGVKGEPLVNRLNGSDQNALIEGSREAARWLAAFHRSSLRVGEPEADWDSLKIFRLCVRLTKATAARPDQRDALLDLMHGLKARISSLPQKRPVTQTHGRYHHDHVFIDSDQISVIDLDRSRPADPSKDVAEFVRVLRMKAFRTHPDMKRADEATTAFLNEYLSLFPEAAPSVPYYWSAFLWLSLFGFVKKLGADDPRREAVIDFHLREMERAMEIKL